MDVVAMFARAPTSELRRARQVGIGPRPIGKHATLYRETSSSSCATVLGMAVPRKSLQPSSCTPRVGSEGRIAAPQSGDELPPNGGRCPRSRTDSSINEGARTRFQARGCSASDGRRGRRTMWTQHKKGGSSVGNGTERDSSTAGSVEKRRTRRKVDKCTPPAVCGSSTADVSALLVHPPRVRHEGDLVVHGSGTQDPEHRFSVCLRQGPLRDCESLNLVQPDYLQADAAARPDRSLSSNWVSAIDVAMAVTEDRRTNHPAVTQRRETDGVTTIWRQSPRAHTRSRSSAMS